jgi:hypothetical protein
MVLGQHAFEARVLGFEQQHSLIEQLADCRLDAGGSLLDEIPPRSVGHPEDVVANVEITLVDKGKRRCGRDSPSPRRACPFSWNAA